MLHEIHMSRAETRIFVSPPKALIERNSQEVVIRNDEYLQSLCNTNCFEQGAESFQSTNGKHINNIYPIFARYYY